MSLTKYNEKRYFNETPEPKGMRGKKGKTLIFTVQRHKASRLHYDFRLEMDGVLRSWAVPKGPSLNTKDKRLAMMVEDHPVSYASFAGMIPEGNYGAGIVEVWDSGTYELSPENEGSGADGIEKGMLKFILHGKKLKGKFALVKLKSGEENAWLLIKDKDEYAVSEPYNSEDETEDTSPINTALKKAKKAAPKPQAEKVVKEPVPKAGVRKKKAKLKMP